LREPGAVEAATVVSFKTAQGIEMQGTLLRLTPQSVTFEVYSGPGTLRLSEVLSEFNLLADTRSIYAGSAVLSSMLYTGSMLVCEASLTGSLLDLDLFQLSHPERIIPQGFAAMVERWQKTYRVDAKYKLAVADLHNFLEELRLWLDQIELGIRARPNGSNDAEILRAMPASTVMNSLFERFEEAAAAVPEELVPIHRSFCRRQLHPLLLCAPFMHRIFTKPLGYAGDYEMIGMILRNGFEGSSLFAKLLHSHIIAQAPARSVRNRAVYFVRRFVEEAARVSAGGRIASFLSLGCGPAGEVEDFLNHHPLSNQTQFSLLDFNEETLRHTGSKLDKCKQEKQRRTPIHLIRKSVHNLFKGRGKITADDQKFDMIYCSGLYDYLDDRMCKALNTFLYDQLQPGGVLIVTNFDPSNPIRHIQEHIFDWFLIYRDARHFGRLAPEQASPEDCRVAADTTGCNVFLEARKPPLAR
jgi:extracellular factor (EF) 3-hydroxypalmitic acid methyl ester biosynthesis protein